MPRPSSPLATMSQLIEPMLASFLKPETERLSRLLEKLILSNHRLGGNSHAFFHKGRTLAQTPLASLRGIQIPRIHPSLECEADFYLELVEKLKADKTRMANALAVIVSRCHSIQGFRDALPEPLAQCLPASVLKPRFEDEGWVLRENPLLKSQFEQVVKTVLYYQANRLIF